MKSKIYSILVTACLSLGLASNVLADGCDTLVVTIKNNSGHDLHLAGSVQMIHGTHVSSSSDINKIVPNQQKTLTFKGNITGTAGPEARFTYTISSGNHIFFWVDQDQCRPTVGKTKGQALVRPNDTVRVNTDTMSSLDTDDPGQVIFTIK